MSSTKSRPSLTSLSTLFAATILITGILPAESPAQDWEQQAMLTASDADDGDLFGCAVAISGDTAVVGAYWEDENGGNSGAAYVYVKEEGEWTQQEKFLSDEWSPDDNFGSAVAISGDTIVIGAHYDDEFANATGSAYIYKRTGVTWTLQAKLSPTAVADARFGESVAIDGDTAIISAFGTQEAYVFIREGRFWTQQALLTPPAEDSAFQYGQSVSLSGNVAAVGAPGTMFSGAMEGAVYIYRRSGPTHWLAPIRVRPDDPATGGDFGISVSISGDTVAIGARNGTIYDIGTRGRTYVFRDRFGTGVWTQEAKLGHNDGSGGWGGGYTFGSSLSLSGNTLVVGDHNRVPWFSQYGSAYFFTRERAYWRGPFEVMASDPEYGSRFGGAVAIDGAIACIGALKTTVDGLEAGTAYIFHQKKSMHMLAIGMDDKGSSMPLRGDSSADLVTSGFLDFAPEHIFSTRLDLAYDSSNPDDGIENKARLIDAIDSMVGPGGPLRAGDTLIVYLAAHGAFDMDPGDESPVCQQDDWFANTCNQYTGDEVLMMGADGTYITDDEFRALFDRPRLAEVNKLFIIDSCFGGGFWGDTAQGDSGDLATLPRSAIIASSPEARFSYASPEGTTYLAHAIENALIELQDSPQITFADLVTQVAAQGTWLENEFGGPNGFMGIVQQNIIDFSDVYGMLAPAEYLVMSASTPDFEFVLGEPPCLPDWNDDGQVNTQDFLAYLNDWAASNPIADINEDGQVDTQDFLAFLNAWAAGC